MNDQKLPKLAVVHEKTVKAAAKHIENAKRKPRRPAKKSTISRVQALKVHPDVWKVAIDIAKDTPSRIQIISETEVIVWNTPLGMPR